MGKYEVKRRIHADTVSGIGGRDGAGGVPHTVHHRV